MPGRNGYFANCELVLPKVVECAEAIVVDTPMYDSETMPAFRGTVSTFLSKPGSGRGSGTIHTLSHSIMKFVRSIVLFGSDE